MNKQLLRAFTLAALFNYSGAVKIEAKAATSVSSGVQAKAAVKTEAKVEAKSNIKAKT